MLRWLADPDTASGHAHEGAHKRIGGSGLVSQSYSAVSKSWVVGTEHFGKDIVITAETDVRLGTLQTTSVIRFIHVRQIAYSLRDHFTEKEASTINIDLTTWSEKGEIETLSFNEGVASLILVAYGPGDRWTTEWSIVCNAVQVKTHLLSGRTLQAFTHWIIGQWLFWLLLVVGGAFLIGRLFSHL